MSTFSKQKFGQRFRDMRLKAGYERQIDLAEKLGTVVQTISNYENGNRLPDAEMLSRIVGVLPCNADYLLGFEDKPTYSLAYISDQTGLSDDAISILIENKLMETDRTPPGNVSFCEFLSYFIQGDQLKLIIKLLRDYFEYANISFLNDVHLDKDLEKLEQLVKRSEESILRQDDLSEDYREATQFLIYHYQRMRSVLGSKNFEMSLFAAKYQVVNIYGEFFEIYLRRILDYIDPLNKD